MVLLVLVSTESTCWCFLAKDLLWDFTAALEQQAVLCEAASVSECDVEIPFQQTSEGLLSPSAGPGWTWN